MLLSDGSALMEMSRRSLSRPKTSSSPQGLYALINIEIKSLEVSIKHCTVASRLVSGHLFLSSYSYVAANAFNAVFGHFEFVILSSASSTSEQKQPLCFIL